MADYSEFVQKMKEAFKDSNDEESKENMSNNIIIQKKEVLITESNTMLLEANMSSVETIETLIEKHNHLKQENVILNKKKTKLAEKNTELCTEKELHVASIESLDQEKKDLEAENKKLLDKNKDLSRNHYYSKIIIECSLYQLYFAFSLLILMMLYFKAEAPVSKLFYETMDQNLADFKKLFNFHPKNEEIMEKTEDNNENQLEEQLLTYIRSGLALSIFMVLQITFIIKYYWDRISRNVQDEEE